MLDAAGDSPFASISIDKLRLVVDSMNEGFALLAADFTILEVNLEALRVDTRKRDDFIGQSHWVAYPGTEHSALGVLYRNAMRERVAGSIEHRYQWPDGRASWFEIRVYPTGDGCLAVFFRDVSERHAALEFLRRSEQRFKAAVVAIDGVLWTNSPSGQMIGEQPGWASLTGQSPEEYDGYGWASAVHPDDAEPTISAWQRAVAERANFIFEHRVRRHDGEWRHFAIRAIPVLDEDGAIVEWVGVHRDVTEARANVALLARNAETFANLVQSNPFGIYVVDADFKLVQISHGAQAIFATVDQPIGRDSAEVMRTIWTEPFASEAIGRFRHTLASGEPYVSTSTIEQRADIDEVEAYDWRIERIVLPDGHFGVVCYFYDLSERNALEQKLKQLLDDKDLLAREIDHRVKNSLSVVGSLLSMQRSATSSDSTRAALDEAADRVNAIARIHEQLHKSDELGVVSFADYLAALCGDLASAMHRDGVKLDLQADAVDLPAEPAMSLALIANELITNAFKHGCAAGATLVSVSLALEERLLVLKVADNGAGLPHCENGNSASLGFKVVTALGRKLRADVTMPKPGEPALFMVSLPMSTLGTGT